MALLEMHRICKSFGCVAANDHIDFSVNQGEIHALLGENGAGKSTLMQILYGLYQADSGKIVFKGKQVHINTPKEAIALGIGMVHQHFMLIPALTVVENIILGMGNNPKVLNLKKAADDVTRLAAKYGIKLDPFALVERLSVGQQQRLEILKALYRGAELLILDEPTAVLTPQEVCELFKMIRRLTEEGHTVIFITHKLVEVMNICDRCTVLRQGRLEKVLEVKDIKDRGELARLMVGKDVGLTVEKPLLPKGEAVMRVKGLSAVDQKGLPVLKGVSFEVCAGEILGVAGVDGNGQSELIECLTGLRKPDCGTVMIKDEDVTKATARQILDKKVSHIPEDRIKMGIIKEMSVKENMILMNFTKAPLSKKGFLKGNLIRQYAQRLCGEFNVKTPSPEETMRKLSGGNQQKVVVGREIDRNPDLLIAVHPARGLDVGATKYIQSRILEVRNRGAAVLLVSTELDEILELSDRIIVLFEGVMTGCVNAIETSREELGLMMTGSPCP
ncbi:MAG: ABC transporter ATP-binding protein [Bacillota bacterium]